MVRKGAVALTVAAVTEPDAARMVRYGWRPSWPDPPVTRRGYLPGLQLDGHCYTGCCVGLGIAVQLVAPIAQMVPLFLPLRCCTCSASPTR